MSLNKHLWVHCPSLQKKWYDENQLVARSELMQTHIHVEAKCFFFFFRKHFLDISVTDTQPLGLLIAAVRNPLFFHHCWTLWSSVLKSWRAFRKIFTLLSVGRRHFSKISTIIFLLDFLWLHRKDSCLVYLLSQSSSFGEYTSVQVEHNFSAESHQYMTALGLTAAAAGAQWDSAEPQACWILITR